MRRVAFVLLAAALAGCVQDGGAVRPVTVTTAAAPPPPPVRSRAESNRDDILKSMVERRLAEADRAALRAVLVEVWQGRCLLMGAVTKPESRRKAEQAARSVTGIDEVMTEIVLAEDRALDLFAPDAAREDAVRRALDIEGKAGIAVRVVNGVAFLLGAASTREQADQLKADALDVEGIKWAVPHLRVR